MIRENFTYQTQSLFSVSTEFKYQRKMNVRGFELCRHYRNENFMKENNSVVEQVLSNCLVRAVHTASCRSLLRAYIEYVILLI